MNINKIVEKAKVNKIKVQIEETAGQREIYKPKPHKLS